MSVKRLTDDMIVDTFEDATTHPNPYATGYGAKIPTRYRLKMDDGFTRRVYAMNYGNSGSVYVLIRGEVHFLP